MDKAICQDGAKKLEVKDTNTNKNVHNILGFRTENPNAF